MNIQLTKEQKQKLFVAVVAFVLAIAAVFGYDFTVVQPRELFYFTSPAPAIGAQSVARTGIRCGTSETNCVEARFGTNLKVYSDNGTTEKFSVAGSSGNTLVAGTLGITGAQTNSNVLHVAPPTTIATGTPGLMVNSNAVGNLLELRKSGTVVAQISGAGVLSLNATPVGWPTPQTLFVQSSAGKKLVCGTTVITGTAALAHTLATPANVQLTLGQDVTYKSEFVTYANSAATVTAKVWGVNVLGTPTASDEGATVDWCVIGTP